ncbi:hypothetical protein BJ875DRAFT_269851 [Amylocarpus encephaloides]|uniref:TMEM205-like domain-containing protein n=1 Tax=Amylocarpus encephaloides TaxID=45428 RepID=A0A9P7Y7A1_9HELO|nr:hypothetical protein BJ875DRAFT_269851 [Amylocarpus encephaloides]
MTDTSIFKSLAPYHIIAYGTLLGTTFFQSFIGGVVAYKALPRPQFSQLQQRIFPIYFALQAALPAALAVTYPASSNPLGATSSISGVLAESNRYSVFFPIAGMFATGVVNMLYTGPQTTKIMRARKVQESRDGKKFWDPAPHSAEMQALNKQFGKIHGISALVNLVGFGAMLWYGVSIAARIQ